LKESTRRIERNPLATVGVTVAAGFAVGLLVGLALRRK